MTSKGLLKFVPLFVVAAAVGGFMSFHKVPVAAENEPVTRINDTTVALTDDALANVVVSKAKVSNFPETLDLMGRVSVTEDRTTVVPARVAGRTDSVFVASGETVTKGQVLLRLFSPDFISAREEYLQSVHQSKGSDDFTELSKCRVKNF